MKNPALVALLAGLVAACGSSTTTDPAPAPPVTEPAPTEPPVVQPPPPVVDHGAVSEKYPAFTPAMGQIADNGGAVLKNPVIVTVTWPDDLKANELENFGDTVGAGQYWKDTVSEYGSNAAVSGEANHIRLPDAAPATFSDKELSAFVATNVANKTFPTPLTGDPVYILYLPKTTSLLLSGKSACAQGIGGYHDSVKVDIKSVAYAIVPRCGSSFESVTVTASHELVEAASDPYPRSRPAWTGFRSEDLAWEFFQQLQSENGDACEFYHDSRLAAGESDVAYSVQRSWSNVSAAAGHDPCVPAFKNTAFFNTTPLSLEDVNVDLSSLGGGTMTTKGIKVAVGATKTIPLGFYSDGPVSSWTIKALPGGIAGGKSGGVDLSLDVTDGQNGQKAYLTITVNTAGKTGSELITIVSQRGSRSHYMPILIASE